MGMTYNLRTTHMETLHSFSYPFNWDPIGFANMSSTSVSHDSNDNDVNSLPLRTTARLFVHSHAEEVEHNPTPKRLNDQTATSSSRQDHHTLMRPRRHQEEILHLHRRIRGLGSKFCALALTEELCARQPQFHVRKVHTETDARACSERVKSFLSGRADFVVKPA